MLKVPSWKMVGLIVLLGHIVSCVDESEPYGASTIAVYCAGLSADDVVRVTVTITGPGIDPSIVDELVGNPQGGWTGLIDNIPSGSDRTFVAQAYDGNNVAIYSGSAAGVTIVGGQANQVIINLQQSSPPDPYENGVPRFESLVVSENTVRPGQTVELTATAADPDNDPLTYSWSADGGEFDAPSSASSTWTAPEIEAVYILIISATDPLGVSATMSFEIDVNSNHESGSADITVTINTWPEVQSLLPTPTRINVGESTVLDLTAVDLDGDSLSYSWTSACSGSFSDPTAEDPEFTLDEDNGSADCALSALIDDNRGGTNVATISIATGPPIDIDTDTTPPPPSRLLVLFDTSGSMLYELRADAEQIWTDGDGSQDPWVGGRVCCPGNGPTSRIYAAKEALSNVILSTSDIEYALIKYPQQYDPAYDFAPGWAASWYQDNQVSGQDDVIRYNGLPVNQTSFDDDRNFICERFAPDSNEQVLAWLDHHEYSATNLGLGFPDISPYPGPFSATDGNGNYLEQELRADGGTPMGLAIGEIERYLSTEISADPLAGERQYGVVMLLDGSNTDAIDPVAATADLHNNLGVDVWVVGLALESSVLEEIAQAGGTQAQSASDLQGLINIMESITDMY